MQRICGSLADAGYDVTLVGREMPGSMPLKPRNYRQVRLHCMTNKGFGFYAEYNLKLWRHLLKAKPDLVCAIDLDTILPVYIATKRLGIPRVYDAHELFCEMKEVRSRKQVYDFWKRIEKFCVPRFRYGYTVNDPIRQILNHDYLRSYEVIMNVPLLRAAPAVERVPPFVIYQGAVNEGRCFEELIPAFMNIEVPLHIYGDGNFLGQAKALVAQYGLEKKVLFKGKLSPEELRIKTREAALGITLFEADSQNNYLSLANRFFDYIHAGIPQVCMNYPAYQQILEEYPVGLALDKPERGAIATAINRLLTEPELRQHIMDACERARNHYNWQHESQRLIQYYQQIFEHAG